MYPEWRKVVVLSKFKQVNLQESDLYGGLGVDEKTILEWTLKRCVSMWVIGLIQLRIGIIGEPLRMRH